MSGLQTLAPATTSIYHAPEYLRAEQGAFRSDIFSLGVITYEMLSGKTLYKNSGRWQYQSIGQHRKDVPAWIDAALKKATASSTKERYPALSEFCQDLRTPNESLTARLHHAPLIERNPLLFWQLSSAILIASLVWLATHTGA